MKNKILLAFIGAMLAISLTGCNDKENDLNKAIKEGTEINRITSGVGQEVPRVVLTPDSPKSQKEGGQ